MVSPQCVSSNSFLNYIFLEKANHIGCTDNVPPQYVFSNVLYDLFEQLPLQFFYCQLNNKIIVICTIFITVVAIPTSYFGFSGVGQDYLSLPKLYWSNYNYKASLQCGLFGGP